MRGEAVHPACTWEDHRVTADIPDPDLPGTDSRKGMPSQPAYPMLTTPPVPEPRSKRRALAGVVTAAAIALLGAALGLLWLVVAPSAPVVKVERGAIPTDPQPEQFIAADGWFSLLGVGFGVLAAIATWFVLRRHRGPVGLVSVAVGSLGAGWLAWWVGREISRTEYHHRRDSVAVGEPFDLPPALRAGEFEWVGDVIPVLHGVPLLPAFTAVVTYTLLAGWSRYPSLRPEPEPTISWGPEAPQTPSAAPAPPAPDAAEPPPD